MNSAITCDICPRACKLEEGEIGFCGVRKNQAGENVDGLYGRFWPLPVRVRDGLSVHFLGCNLKCWFCILPTVSNPQREPSTYQFMPEIELVDLAEACGCVGICFTGGEPALHYEYILAASQICRERGLRTVLVTNGYIHDSLAERLSGAVDRAAVGIKGSGSKRLYAMMDADPQRCLDVARIFWQAIKETSITNLTGLGLMATPEDDLRLADWIRESLGSSAVVDLEVLRYPVRVPTTNPADYPCVEGYERALARVHEVAARLREAGLLNIWISHREA